MDDKQTYSLTVNGEQVHVTTSPKTWLMDVLRDDLQLTGTKDGCGTGHCGSCMVIVDGEPVRSCIVTMQRVAHRANVETIEGLSNGDLHPIQQAYIDQGATQCGFCTPGMIMAGVGLLDQNPEPSESEIRHCLEGNICRCTGYQNIVKAFQSASHSMKGGS